MPLGEPARVRVQAAHVERAAENDAGVSGDVASLAGGRDIDGDPLFA